MERSPIIVDCPYGGEDYAMIELHRLHRERVLSDYPGREFAIVIAEPIVRVGFDGRRIMYAEKIVITWLDDE